MKKLLTIFGIFSLLLGSMPQNLQASTDISGSIVSSTWTEAGSPYIIDGIFTVQSGAKLTIEPGVVVQFQSGARLVINGEISAIGEENNKIFFTSSQASPARGDWSGIEFGANSIDATLSGDGNYVNGSVIKNAVIKYADEIIANNSHPCLENILFLNNNIALNLTGEETALAEKYSTIKNNDFHDNNIAINVNYTLNAEDDDDDSIYSSLPGGSITNNYEDVVPMAVITDNYFLNNNKSILVSSAKNVFIKKNTITSSNQEGIFLTSGSEKNILEQNTINNNLIGINVASADSKITQNTINNNYQYGIQTSVADTYIKNNNIYDNQTYNLYSQASSIDVSDNYWGVNTSTSAYQTMSANSLTYNPISTVRFDNSLMVAPVINSYVAKTNSTVQDISGIKPSDTAIYINNKLIKERGYETDWQYYAELNVGDNAFTVYYMDAQGNKSLETSLTINREEIIIISEPTINSYPAETNSKTVSLQGSKDANTNICINGTEIVANNGNTSWSYQTNLNMGLNEFVVTSKNADGISSNQVKIFITRNDIDPNEVIEEEKNLVTTVDQALKERLKGMILLQIEKNGEAWYLNPEDGKKYFLGRESNAFEIMNHFGLGIAHAELEKYLADVFPERLAGKIMLDVEASGEAYYINPKDLKGYFLGKPKDAFQIMRELSLGISNENIRKIEVGKID